MRRGLVLLAAWPLLLAASAACAEVDAPMLRGTPIRVDGRVVGEKPDDTSTNVSGMACRPAAVAGPHDCLVIDDQRGAAQHVRLENGRLIALPAEVLLLDRTPPMHAAGTEPRVTTCPGGTRPFKDLDGEAVTFMPASPAGEGHFYITGSHGCGRNNERFRSSSFLVARVPADAQGRFGPVALSWRLTGALLADTTLAPHFGASLNGEHGLNVEGLAAQGGDLLFGLRGPTVAETAYILRVNAEALFNREGPDPTGHRFELGLGTNVGIRDLATLPSGELLVLAGPTQDQNDINYRLLAATLVHPGDRPGGVRLRELGQIEPEVTRDAKAEGVTVLGERDGALHLIVTFDNPENGGPRRYEIPQWRRAGVN